MSETMELEVWIVWDADGDYVVANDEDEAVDLFESNVGNFRSRIAKIMVTVPKPTPLEASVSLTEDQTEQVVVKA